MHINTILHQNIFRSAKLKALKPGLFKNVCLPKEGYALCTCYNIHVSVRAWTNNVYMEKKLRYVANSKHTLFEGWTNLDDPPSNEWQNLYVPLKCW